MTGADKDRIELSDGHRALPESIVEIISVVSHELRSPLTSIKGFASTLVNKWEQIDDTTKKRLVSTIDRDADRITRLITELLDISRLESGTFTLRREAVDVSEIATSLVERLRPQGTERIIQIDFEPAFPKVPADRDKVEQILTNLVENALTYGLTGNVIVNGKREEGSVRVSVSDRGPGIPASERLQIFDKFVRREPDKRNHRGTGLGLYICKGLVEAHGGRIWADANPAGGSVFTFTLPL